MNSEEEGKAASSRPVSSLCGTRVVPAREQRELSLIPCPPSGCPRPCCWTKEHIAAPAPQNVVGTISSLLGNPRHGLRRRLQPEAVRGQQNDVSLRKGTSAPTASSFSHSRPSFMPQVSQLLKQPCWALCSASCWSHLAACCSGPWNCRDCAC